MKKMENIEQKTTNSLLRKGFSLQRVSELKEFLEHISEHTKAFADSYFNSNFSKGLTLLNTKSHRLMISTEILYFEASEIFYNEEEHIATKKGRGISKEEIKKFNKRYESLSEHIKKFAEDLSEFVLKTEENFKSSV